MLAHSIPRLLCSFLLGCLVVMPAPAIEQADTAPTQPDTNQQPTTPPPVYKPPKRGSPAVRVGGATRGSDDPLPALHVLAPDHIGLTVQAQPVFQWYLSKPATVRFEFALVRDDAVEPVLEFDLGTVHSRGIQKFDLADTDISLETGVTYQWSVALIPDEQARSGDVVASGMIERIAMPSGLAVQVAAASEYQRTSAYAGAGVWYDALATLSKLIAENPVDLTMREQRSALLEQVGLPAVGLPDEM